MIVTLGGSCEAVEVKGTVPSVGIAALYFADGVYDMTIV
jgi:hypothetical protein